MMKSQLYLPESRKRFLKSKIQSFVQVYYQKLLPVFSDIASEADRVGNEFYNDYMTRPGCDEDTDPASIAAQAVDMGLEHYSYLKLGKYSLTATWHATLYQLWEQQVRLFLFEEMSHMSHILKLEFKTFCSNGMDEIKKTFLFHNVDIEQLACWQRIYQLQLLCNVIKHGQENSADKLRNINPNLFRREHTPFKLSFLRKK